MVYVTTGEESIPCLEGNFSTEVSAKLNIFERDEIKAQRAYRACGLAGYDIAFTWRGSPVRIRAGPFVFRVRFGILVCLVSHSDR